MEKGDSTAGGAPRLSSKKVHACLESYRTYIPESYSIPEAYSNVEKTKPKTKKSIAEKIGVSRVTYDKWSKKDMLLKHETVRKIAAAFDLSERSLADIVENGLPGYLLESGRYFSMDDQIDFQKMDIALEEQDSYIHKSREYLREIEVIAAMYLSLPGCLKEQLLNLTVGYLYALNADGIAGHMDSRKLKSTIYEGCRKVRGIRAKIDGDPYGGNPYGLTDDATSLSTSLASFIAGLFAEEGPTPHP